MIVVAFAYAGCDSNEDEGDGGDAERFIGTWEIVSAADQGGARDQTAVFSALGTLTVALNDDASYALVLQYTDDTPDLTVPGIYTVNESTSRLILTVQLPDLPQVDLSLTYRFISDTQVEFTADATTLAILLGAELEGNVILVADKR